MDSYLDAHDLEEAVKKDYEVVDLPNNSTLAQMKKHKDKKTWKTKAKSRLFAAVSNSIFNIIMPMKIPQNI